MDFDLPRRPGRQPPDFAKNEPEYVPYPTYRWSQLEQYLSTTIQQYRGASLDYLLFRLS